MDSIPAPLLSTKGCNKTNASSTDFSTMATHGESICFKQWNDCGEFSGFKALPCKDCFFFCGDSVAWKERNIVRSSARKNSCTLLAFWKTSWRHMFKGGCTAELNNLQSKNKMKNHTHATCPSQCEMLTCKIFTNSWRWTTGSLKCAGSDN